MGRQLEPFVSYIPMDRRQALADGANLGHRATGAVLFADISGFTPLTAILYKELGPQRGAEELDRLLNHIYDALIGRIHHFRGSVTGFSGDAVTGWFNGDDGLWATACALEMQEIMAQIGDVILPSGSTLPLAIRAAVTAGHVRRLIAGDPQVQLIDTIAGDTLDRAISAEKLAGSGEVIVGPEVLKHLDGHVRLGDSQIDDSGQTFAVIQALSEPVQGRPWLPVPANFLDEKQFQPWILPPVYERLSTGYDQFLAELRTSVALFLKFGGLDYENDGAVGDKLDHFIRWVQSVLAHYEGSLLNLTVGDKGSYLMAAFGAPLAHEDDARRAVNAALDLLAPPPELDGINDMRIGISQGLMFSGAYGGSERRTYGVLGAETNTAARLMEMAGPGEIMVTSRIAESTTSSHLFEELAPVSVKGLQEPLPVCRLLGRRHGAEKRSTAHAITEMVGRLAERNLLADELDALQAGEEGGVDIIEGEAGIGKSRLLEDLLQQAKAKGILFYLGAGDAIEKNAAYHAYRPVFWDYFDLGAEADYELMEAGRLSQSQVEQIIQTLQTAVPGQAQLAPLLEAVLPLELPDNENTAQLSGEARADQTRNLLLALLAARANQEPLLLILEDAHWLDSASWALTRLVSREIASLMLVLATRPMAEPLPTEYAFLLRRVNTQRIFLKTLPPDETLQLVCQRLGVGSLPDEVSELLIEKGSGHPFFSEELAFALRDAGLLRIDDGQAYLMAGADDLSQLSFPESIDSVITSRIDLLTAQQQLTLKVASVIGRVFAYIMLRDIYPVQAERDKLRNQLITLERLDITPLETPEPDLSYIFKHIITQEVAYNLMSFAQRQELHAAVARWLEETYRDDLAPYYPLLAYHWRAALGDQYGRSDLAENAVDYLEKAAEQALDNYANREASTYFNDLLRLDNLLPDHAGRLRRAHWQRGLGEVEFRLGNWEDAGNHFEETLRLLGHPFPSNNRSLMFNIMGLTAQQFFYRLRSPKPSEGSKLNAEEQHAVRVASHAYRGLDLVYFYREDPIPVIYTVLSNMNLTEHLGLSPELVEAFSMMTGALAGIAIHPITNAYTRWTREMADECDDKYVRAWTYHYLGFNLLFKGEWPPTQEILDEGSDLCLQLGDYGRLWDHYWGMFAILYYRQGKYVSSRDYFAELFTSGNRRGVAQPQLWGLLGQVENELWLSNDTDKIMGMLDQAETLLASRNVSLNEHIRFHGLKAETYMQVGYEEPAYESAKKTLELAQQAKLLIPYSYEGYAAPAEVFLTLWENGYDSSADQPDQLSRLAKESLKFPTSIAKLYPAFRPRGLNFQGRHEWVSGKQKKAFESWMACIDLARQMEMPQEKGLAHFEIGRHLPLEDPDRVTHLQRAIELFTQVESGYYLERAQSELEKIPIDA